MSANEREHLSAGEIIDLERAQIGHDLHDLLLPLLFAASANLEPLLVPQPLDADSGEDAPDPGQPHVRERVQQSHQWLAEAMRVGRNLLTTIYPPELDQLTWLAAAKDVAERICGEDCEVAWIVDPASPMCDPGWDRDVAAMTYRVLVESLRNARRHGQAATITVYCQPQQLLVVDDGLGFDPKSVPGNRFGIRSMKGRAKLLGKALSIDSAPGGPTTVRLELA